ncbi:hypothetical protein PFISCL1PPCAC_26770, partial [Pristionchus fissidentatus]
VASNKIRLLIAVDSGQILLRTCDNFDLSGEYKWSEEMLWTRPDEKILNISLHCTFGVARGYTVLTRNKIEFFNLN